MASHVSIYSQMLNLFKRETHYHPEVQQILRRSSDGQDVEHPDDYIDLMTKRLRSVKGTGPDHGPSSDMAA